MTFITNYLTKLKAEMEIHLGWLKREGTKLVNPQRTSKDLACQKFVLAVMLGLILPVRAICDPLPEGGPYTEVVDGVSWTFVVTNGTAGVGTGESSYTGKAITYPYPESISIPNILGERKVQVIMDYAFRNHDGLKSVAIPSSITNIGRAAFAYCTRLNDINIPEGITKIDDYAFQMCCPVTNIVIPSSVVSIGQQAFGYCTHQKTIVIPEGVTSIGEKAFVECSSLKSVTIPSSVNSMASHVFYNCYRLADAAFAEGVKDTGEWTFLQCTNLTSVTLPSSMTNIGYCAFYGCTNLRKMTIPSGITHIGWGPFEKCSSLDAVDFEGAPPSGIKDARISNLDATIRYNVAYQAQWEPVVTACGWTNAKPYLPSGFRITNVVARQRYPWNGLVDIAVTIEGTKEDVDASRWYFSATNNETQLAIKIDSVSRNGEDSGSGTTWTRKFVWDAKKDVGAVKISEVGLYVNASLGVQLWEDGPYFTECNVGASKPEEYGYYFWWGDTIGYAMKSGTWVSDFSRYENVTWESSSGETMSSSPFTSSDCPTADKDTTWLKNNGYIDDSGNLIAAHDAAMHHYGTPWRLPTDAEHQALINNCDTIITSQNGVYGLLVRGRGAYASNCIFLPAGGAGDGATLRSPGSAGYCWSSSPHSWWEGYAWALSFGSSYGSSYFQSSDKARCGGRSVRPVRGNNTLNEATSTTKSASLSLDCRDGVRIAGETETITYSSEWADCVPNGAVAVVKVGEDVLTNAPGSGTIGWSPKYDGEYVLTHKIFVSGIQIGQTLSSSFSVTGKNIPFPAGAIAVNGYEGVYDGKSHGIMVAVKGVDEAQVRYSLSESGPFLQTVPKFVDSCDTNVWYEVSALGYITIIDKARVSVTNRCVTLAAQAKSWSYDGEWHTHPIAKCTSELDFVSGETLSTNFTGCIKEVGKEPNAFSLIWDGTAKPGNYNVTLITNDLTVVPSAPVVVSISAQSMTREYTGEEYRNDGFTFKASNPLFGWNDFSFSGCSNLASVAVCNLAMNLKSSDFVLRGSHFESASFVIDQDGTLVINRATIDPAIVDPVDPDPSDPAKPFSTYDTLTRYDGKKHTIDTNALYAVSIPAATPEFSFAKDSGGQGLQELPKDVEWVSEPPTYVESGEYAVWYRVLDANYNEYVHKARVTIIPNLQVKQVVAKQRYPWNGLVDIVVTLEGVKEEVSAAYCTFVATNIESASAIQIESITRKGEDVAVGSTWVRKYVWDARQDVGAVIINRLSICVGAKIPGVQLWKDGPYWSECNLGATKPEEYGHYFWWGDTLGYKRNEANNGWISVKDITPFIFNASNCSTANKSISQLQAEGYLDADGNLAATHDAAVAYLGAPWRMPTETELGALFDNCTTQWTICNGVSGYLVTGKGEVEQKSIFLPATGYGYESSLNYPTSVGRYWTSTPNSSTPSVAWMLDFDTDQWFNKMNYYRYGGLPVRPVRIVSCDSDPLFQTEKSTILVVDCREGARITSSPEMISYSTEWVEDTPDGAVAVVMVDDSILTNATGSGIVEWKPRYDGEYVIAHSVLTNGVIFGDTMTATFKVEGVAPETPVINPQNGSVITGSSLSISMTCASPDATIHYTTDGSIPTVDSPTYKRFKIYEKTTVKAIAFWADGTSSKMAVSEYAKGQHRMPVITPEDGAEFEHKDQVVSIKWDSEDGWLRITLDGSEPTNESALYTGPFTIDETTTIKAKAFGDQYFDSEVAAATLTRKWVRVATPVISANDEFTGSKQKVEIATATEGATIYYTLDGSEPTKTSFVYDAPFFVFETCNVQAIATKVDYLDSEIAVKNIIRKWSIGDTMGKPDHKFNVGGDEPFSRMVDATATLGESMRSGKIQNDQKSILSTTVVGPGTISFRWRSSCEEDEEYEWDHGEFKVDGNIQSVINGEKGWISVVLRIEGDCEHTITWEYVKDYEESVGEDAIWVADYHWESDYIATKTTQVPVPYTWLDAHCRDAIDEYEIYEKVAKQKAYNGRNTVEECYVAGLDPENKTNYFHAAILIGSDGKPVITYEPDLKSARKYTTHGCNDLNGTWHTPINDADRFFKVTVEIP